MVEIDFLFPPCSNVPLAYFCSNRGVIGGSLAVRVWKIENTWLHNVDAKRICWIIVKTNNLDPNFTFYIGFVAYSIETFVEFVERE